MRFIMIALSTMQTVKSNGWDRERRRRRHDQQAGIMGYAMPRMAGDHGIVLSIIGEAGTASLGKNWKGQRNARTACPRVEQMFRSSGGGREPSSKEGASDGQMAVKIGV